MDEDILQKPTSVEEVSCNACATSGKSCQRVLSKTKLMNIQIQKRKPHVAQMIFENLVEEGHKPSLISYTTLLTAITKQKRFGMISTIVSQVMSNDGMKLDSIFFNAVINAFSEAGQVDEAMTFFWKMKKTGCEPTTSTYNTLIKAYGIVGRPEESLKMLDLMYYDEKKPTPNLRTYNMLISAWCKKQNIEEAWKMLDKMRSCGMKPDVVTYNTMAKAYAANEETYRAENLMLEMNNMKVRPNEMTCGIIIGGYCSEGNMDEALEFMHNMKYVDVKPNTVMLNTLIKGFISLEDMIGVDEVMTLMEEYGLKPDIVTYSIQMDSWSEIGNIKRCQEIYEDMVDAGIEPDTLVYSILAKCYVRAGEPDRAEQVMETMERLNLRPNVVVYTTIIGGWCSAANMENAERVFDKMCDSNVSPNQRTFDTLIWGYGEQRQPWKAEEVVKRMVKMSVLPNEDTMQLVADAWNALGLQAEEGFQEMNDEEKKIKNVDVDNQVVGLSSNTGNINYRMKMDVNIEDGSDRFDGRDKFWMRNISSNMSLSTNCRNRTRYPIGFKKMSHVEVGISCQLVNFCTVRLPC